MNALQKLILENPNAEWDWIELSANLNITPEFYKNNKELKWNNMILVTNPNFRDVGFDFIQPFDPQVYSRFLGITEKLLLENLNENWSWTNLSQNPGIKFETILKNLHLPWNWHTLSKTTEIENIINNPQLPWKWEFISNNPNINLEFIKKNIDKKWDWIKLSYNEVITCDFVLQNHNLPWYFTGLSIKIKGLNRIFIKKYEHKLDWDTLSMNDNLTLSIVLDNMDMPWNWRHVFSTIELKIEDIENNPQIKWDFEFLSLNFKISEKLVLKYSHSDWNYYSLSSNYNISTEFIITKLDEDPGFFISSNPNLTYSMIKKHPDLKFIYSNLSMNEFSRHLHKEKRKKIIFSIFTNGEESLIKILPPEICEIISDYASNDVITSPKFFTTQHF